MLNMWAFCCCLFSLMGGFTASSNVVLSGNNVAMTFDSKEANFAPSVKWSKKCGTLYLAAEPLDACSRLTNKIIPRTSYDTKSPFVLIARGGCNFDDKVRRAQDAGFEAAIIYDNQIGDHGLFRMVGNSTGININAVLVSKDSGEILSKYAGLVDMELRIDPPLISNALKWFIIGVFLLSFVVFVLTIIYMVCMGAQSKRKQDSIERIRSVKAIPTVIFKGVSEDNSTSRACAICLEDYIVGEKLRILPCRHRFHLVCVDIWLCWSRSFCPVCKHDVNTITNGPPPSESTPLLSSVSASSYLSTFHSSSTIQIDPRFNSHLQSVEPEELC